MSHVLVVDNCHQDCRQVRDILTAEGYTVAFADGLDSAITELERQPADAILFDSAMPTINGVNFVERLRQTQRVPIVIVSSKGHETQAILALQHGASSYVPKHMLAEELPGTLRDILEYSKQEQFQVRMLEQMAELQCKFVLESDRALIPPLVTYLQEHLSRMGICDSSELMRVGIALDEALTNAICHGNLDLNSELREDGDAYYRLAAERRTQPPYRDRRLYVDALICRDVAEIVIRDEGRGFDPKSLPDPRDPANMEKVSGRGVLLMRTFMDGVEFNEHGNAVILRKYRQSVAPSAPNTDT